MLVTAYEKYSGKADADNSLTKNLTRKMILCSLLKRATWYKGDDSEIDKLQWITGSQSFQMNGFPSMILI